MKGLRSNGEGLSILLPVALIALMVLRLSGSFRKDVIPGGKIEAKESSA